MMAKELVTPGLKKPAQNWMDCRNWRWLERIPGAKVSVTFSGEATGVGINRVSRELTALVKARLLSRFKSWEGFTFYGAADQQMPLVANSRSRPNSRANSRANSQPDPPRIQEIDRCPDPGVRRGRLPYAPVQAHSVQIRAIRVFCPNRSWAMVQHAARRRATAIN